MGRNGTASRAGRHRRRTVAAGVTAIAAGMLAILMTAAMAAGEAPAEPLRRLPASDIGAACLDRESVVSTEICYAFALGVIQAQERLQDGVEASEKICLPDEVTRADVIAAIRRHFRRALAETRQPADEFVVAALAARFACEATH